MLETKSCHTCINKDCCAKYNQLDERMKEKHADDEVAEEMALELRARWQGELCDKVMTIVAMSQSQSEVNTD